MRRMFSAFTFVAVLAFGQSTPHFDITRVKADIDFLCMPELNGRVSLDHGANIAAAYIRGEFAKARVDPAAGGSFYQEFALVESAPLSPESRLVLVSGSRRTVLQTGKDFRGNSRSDVDIAAPLVFAGYGITAPEYKYDDYAGIEARGKVAVVFNHEPQEADPRSLFRGTGLTRHANIRSKLMNAAAHGATALLLLSEPKSLHSPSFAVPLPGQLGVTRGFAPPQYDETVPIPYLTLSDPAGAKLVMRSGKTPAELQESIDRTLKPESRDLPGTSAEIRLHGEHRRGISYNVAALLPGSDPTLATETIIINSHYDHLPNRGETHYPGANDNASGSAAMLELARAFAASPERPRRSLLFVSFGSEEEGLLGSYYYVEHPLRPLASTLAVLNLDMIGRDESHIAATKGKLNVPADTSNLVNLVGGDYSPDLVAAIRRANKFANLELDEKYERDSTQNVLFRCDHFPFLWKDVPAVWIFGGFHPGYHEASDTPDRLNWSKLQSVMRLTWQTVWELDKGTRPSFKDR